MKIWDPTTYRPIKSTQVDTIPWTLIRLHDAVTGLVQCHFDKTFGSPKKRLETEPGPSTYIHFSYFRGYIHVRGCSLVDLKGVHAYQKTKPQQHRDQRISNFIVLSVRRPWTPRRFNNPSSDVLRTSNPVNRNDTIWTDNWICLRGGSDITVNEPST